MRSVLRCPLRRWSPTSSRPCGAIRSGLLLHAPALHNRLCVYPHTRTHVDTHPRTYARTSMRAHPLLPNRLLLGGVGQGKFALHSGAWHALAPRLGAPSPAGPAIPAAQTDGRNDAGSGRPACPTRIPNRPIGDPSRQSPLGTQRRPYKFVVWCACPAGVVRRTERVQVTVISGDTGCGKTTQCPQVRTAGGCFEHTRRNARRPLASPRPPFSPSTLAILPLTLFSLPRPLLHPYLAARCRLHFVVLMCVAVHPR